MQSFKRSAKWYLLATLFLANALIWYAIFAESRNGILTVAFLDVGQGDSIYIEAPNGNQMLIDGGPNRSVLKALSDVMPFYDRSIDVVVATHPDKDHIGGLPAVLERFNVDFFLEPGVPGDSSVYTQLLRSIEVVEAENILARRGMKVVLDDEVYFMILFPDRDVSGMNPNDASIIGKLIYNDTSFLFTGDAPKKIENFLVSIDGENLDVNVLKVGHHGSRTSTSKLFLGYVSPLAAVISLGRDNRYGHPHKEVLDTLENFEMKVLQTDRDGTIIITSNGRDISF